MQLLKKLSCFLYNFKQKMVHKPSMFELELINNTQLFPPVSSIEDIGKLGKIRLAKYIANQVIVTEGDFAQELYIIVQGEVQIFTFDSLGKKITLHTLSEGNYFGEHSIAKSYKKIRNASVEALTDVTLIAIRSESTKNAQLDEKLVKRRLEQGLQKMSSLSGSYRSLLTSIEAEGTQITSYEDQEMIFNVGDESDEVFFILQGVVKILLFDKAKDITKTYIHKGHLFGELGVLKNKPRSAAAVAEKNLQVLRIKAPIFRKLANDLKFNQYLTSLERTYHLPLKGFVEQYFQKSQDMGDTVTNIYKLNDGRNLILTSYLQEKLFTMCCIDYLSEKDYMYDKGEGLMVLGIAQDKIVQIIFQGENTILPLVVKLVLDNTSIDKKDLEQFSETGTLEALRAIRQSNIICQCMLITEGEIEHLIEAGYYNLDSISKETGACSTCRGCAGKILAMLDKRTWMSGSMEAVKIHNSEVTSYRIRLDKDNFYSLEPGQHIIIQANIDNQLVGRPYTISEIINEDTVTVTIRKRPGGVFSNWLNKHPKGKFSIEVMQPPSQFILNVDPTNPLLCFAKGIGIVPFLTFAKEISLSQSNKKMHVVYSEVDEKDFLFKKEFKEFCESSPNITIQYLSTKDHRALNKTSMQAILKEYDDPEIYVCGEENYISAIRAIIYEMHAHLNIRYEKY